MNQPTTRRAAAACMIAAALLATAGFTALGTVFDYPAILDEPTAAILVAFRRHEAAVTAWFAVLVLAAALLAPIAVLLGRLADGRRRARWVTGLGVAAAVVQVIGLSRWVLLVPGLADDALDPARAADALHRFEVAHTWLGHALGETVGYAATAAFTVAVVRSVPAVPRWGRRLGLVAAVLVATGVLVPLGVDLAGLTNFAGYILWTVWMFAVAVSLTRTAARPPAVGSARTLVRAGAPED